MSRMRDAGMAVGPFESTDLADVLGFNFTKVLAPVTLGAELLLVLEDVGLRAWVLTIAQEMLRLRGVLLTILRLVGLRARLLSIRL